MPVPYSIQAFLDRAHVPYVVIEHPFAYTAQEEAEMAHIPGREWAKTVIWMADEQPVIVALPADSFVDFEALRDLLGAQTLRLATEVEMADLYRDCAIGAMPPLGPLYEQPVVVDKRLRDDLAIVFNGGSHCDAIQMRYPDFETLVHPTVAEIGVPRHHPGAAHA
jgi:Ala-tRNA(Pro) deacylase